MRTQTREAPKLATFPLRFQKVATLAGIALALALGLLGEPAAAQEGAAADAEPSWIPSLSVDFETFQYSATSNVTNLVNPPAQEGNVSNDSAQLLIGIEGGLMGPSFESLPGRPRLFVQGGAGINTFSGTKLAEIGLLQGDTPRDISQFNIVRAGDIAAGCMNRNPPTCATALPGDFQGQGSEVTSHLKTPEWNASLGVAFAFPMLRSLLLQVKPSVTYNFDRVKFGGRIRTVVETDPVNEVFEIYEGSGGGSTTDHSLGMGLELDLALFRDTRPIRASLFVDTRFLWLLSNPTTTFSDDSGMRTFWTSPAVAVTEPAGPVGAYRVERDGFEVRGGAGVRLSWVGFGRR